MFRVRDAPLAWLLVSFHSCSWETFEESKNKNINRPCFFKDIDPIVRAKGACRRPLLLPEGGNVCQHPPCSLFLLSFAIFISLLMRKLIKMLLGLAVLSWHVFKIVLEYALRLAPLRFAIYENYRKRTDNVTLFRKRQDSIFGYFSWVIWLPSLWHNNFLSFKYLRWTRVTSFHLETTCLLSKIVILCVVFP